MSVELDSVYAVAGIDEAQKLSVQSMSEETNDSKVN